MPRSSRGMTRVLRRIASHLVTHTRAKHLSRQPHHRVVVGLGTEIVALDDAVLGDPGARVLENLAGIRLEKRVVAPTPAGGDWGPKRRPPPAPRRRFSLVAWKRWGRSFSECFVWIAGIERVPAGARR